MKITLNKSNFENILNKFQPFLEKRDSSQITSHIYFETQDNKLLLKATDYEIGIESKIDIIKKDEDGIATVNGKNILERIKSLNDGEINIEINNNSMIIKQKRTKLILKTFNATEFNNATRFPNLNELETQKLNIDPKVFIHSIQKVKDTINTSNENRLPATLGALINIKDYKCNFVAAENRRLTLVKKDTQSIGAEISLIIPKKSLDEIIKLFYDEFEIHFNQNMLFIKSNNFLFFTKLINDKFPDYEKLIPSESKIKLEINKSDFVESINIVKTLNTPIKVTFEKGKINFETISNEELEYAQTDISANIDLEEPFSIGVESKMILDFLRFSENETFFINLNGQNQSIFLKNEDYITILAAIHLN